MINSDVQGSPKESYNYTLLSIMRDIRDDTLLIYNGIIEVSFDEVIEEERKVKEMIYG